MTEYEIIDQVSRFVKRFGMIMDPETMNKARDEADEYEFQTISEGHYAVLHGAKMYVIIEQDGQIGCSCEDMTFNRMDGAVCKHLIQFTRLLKAPEKMISDLDKAHLMNVCGWSGDPLHPEIELGGPGAVIQENMSPDPEKPKDLKIYTRRCAHCDEVFSGADLDEVKKQHAAHLKVCGMNSRAKPYKQTSDPDGEDQEGTDPTPEKPPKKPPVKVSVECQYCGMGATRKDQKSADAWLKNHEASCSKNPAKAKTVQRPTTPEVPEQSTTALSTGDEDKFPDQRTFTNAKVKSYVENRGGFYKSAGGKEVPDSAAMSIYALDTCRISTETMLIEKDADQAKAIVRGHKGGVSVDASVILRFDVLRRRELLKMAKKYPKAILDWSDQMMPILDLNFILKDKTPMINLGEHMINFAIDQEQFAERVAETLARRRVFDMLTGVDWRDDVEVQVEDADAASMGSKKRR